VRDGELAARGVGLVPPNDFPVSREAATAMIPRDSNRRLSQRVVEFALLARPNVALPGMDAAIRFRREVLPDR
jgi:hypothetical protein